MRPLSPLRWACRSAWFPSLHLCKTNRLFAQTQTRPPSPGTGADIDVSSPGRLSFLSCCGLRFVTTIESYYYSCIPFVPLVPRVQEQSSNPGAAVTTWPLSFPLCPTGMSYSGPTERGSQFRQHYRRTAGRPDATCPDSCVHRINSDF